MWCLKIWFNGEFSNAGAIVGLVLCSFFQHKWCESIWWFYYMKCLFLACLYPDHCHILRASQTLLFWDICTQLPLTLSLSHSSGRKSPPDVSQLRCAFQAQLCKSTRQSQPVGGKCGQAQSSCSQSPSQNCLNSAFCRATLAVSFALPFSFRLIEMHKGCLKSMDKKCTWLWHGVSKTSSSLSHSKSPRGSWGWTDQL